MNILNVKIDKYEGHKFWGIATVEFKEGVVIRYKILISPKGITYFKAPAILVDDQFKEAFCIDRSVLREEIETKIREALNSWNISQSPTEPYLD